MPYKRTAHTDNIDSYMHHIEQFSRISTEREKELSLIIHGEDAAAAEKALHELVTSNLKLVIKIAHDFKQYSLGFADLVAEGNLGLMTAANKYLPDKGAKFSCYAAWWIKQAMRKAIAETTRTIRLPTEQAKRQVLIEKTRRIWEQETGEQPTIEEVASKTGLSAQSIHTIDNAAVCSFSLSDSISEDNDTKLETMIADSTDDSAARKDAIRGCLDMLLSKLQDIDLEIVKYSYGIGGITASPQLIAQETGLTTKAVTARLAAVLQQLGSDLQGLEDELDY